MDFSEAEVQSDDEENLTCEQVFNKEHKRRQNNAYRSVAAKYYLAGTGDLLLKKEYDADVLLQMTKYCKNELNFYKNKHTRNLFTLNDYTGYIQKQIKSMFLRQFRYTNAIEKFEKNSNKLGGLLLQRARLWVQDKVDKKKLLSKNKKLFLEECYKLAANVSPDELCIYMKSVERMLVDTC